MTDPRKPLEPQPPPIESRPAADIQLVPTDAGAVLKLNSALRWPEEDINDFPVRVRASVLTRCRERLLALTRAEFALGELLLGVASLAMGGLFSALTSGIPLESFRGGAFFIGLPLVGMGAGVAYAIRRQTDLISVRQLAGECLKDLPDPAKAKLAEGAK